MKVVFSSGKIKKIERCVVTLGVFDGLHLGHLKILKKVTRYAQQIKGKSVVVTFSPHPQKELYLYSLQHRLRLFKEIGIDVCIIIRFTDAFSKVSAQAFIENFLIRRLRPYGIFVGSNFTFGKKAAGTPLLLKKYAHKYVFKLKVFPTYKLEGRIISSSYIRQLIHQGRLLQAERLLGRPVSILGTVIKGSRLGRQLGFPTANIIAHHEVTPPPGVYIARVNINNEKLKGVCYIGSKPTLRRQGAKQIEVHIFGFNKNLYGKDLEIQFIKKIRREKKFTAIIHLAQQIRKDVKQAQSFFNRH